MDTSNKINCNKLNQKLYVYFWKKCDMGFSMEEWINSESQHNSSGQPTFLLKYPAAGYFTRDIRFCFFLKPPITVIQTNKLFY